MSIELNGEPTDIERGTTLLTLIEVHAGSARGSAVVVDGSVIPRAAWPTFIVDDGQQVELITAVQGG
jgi:sulfur carrier protein